MTKRKDLKRRVRARQVKTGERYTAALRRLREKRPKKVDLVLQLGGVLVAAASAPARQAIISEAPEATAEARAEGLRCTAVVSTRLREERDLRPLFARLRELLAALDAPACGPLLRGEPSPLRVPTPVDFLEARRFLALVREGARGLSRNGQLFALSWQGRTVVGSILVHGTRTPLLQLGCLEESGPAWLPELGLVGIGR